MAAIRMTAKATVIHLTAFIAVLLSQTSLRDLLPLLGAAFASADLTNAPGMRASIPPA
jgi:hypothetical protein